MPNRTDPARFSPRTVPEAPSRNPPGEPILRRFRISGRDCYNRETTGENAASVRLRLPGGRCDEGIAGFFPHSGMIRITKESGVFRHGQTMKTSRRKMTGPIVLVALFLACILVPGIPRPASGAEDLQSKVTDAGKSVEKSVDQAARQTGAYLKSDSFHRKVKQIVDGAAVAIKNAGNWVGSKIDAMSKKDPPKH